MNVSLNWLKEFVEFDLSVEELEQRLTMLGLEIEAIERPGAEIANVVTGRILEVKPHPDADKLVVCRTDIGQAEPLQIVCGAKNMGEGDIVPTAVIGATLPGGFAIGKRKMRGIESQGMMCSSRELGLGEDHDGLMILPADTPIGADAVKLLGLDDVIFEIEITPNRGDWAGMIGVARELAASLGTSFRTPEVKIAESSTTASSLSSVTIDAPELCPRYIGRVLRSLKIGPSPQWLARRLVHAGNRPINNVVDITNYVLLETGHPLHAFDYAKLIENRIVVRRAKAGETIRTIDDQVRKLTEQMLVIADAKNPVAVAGVMGGADSEVTDATTDVFLESAFFQPRSIRATSKALGLTTEASQRFQRGADPEMALYAANRAAQLMQEICGAEVAQGVIDAYPLPPKPIEITLRYSRTDALLGAEIAADTQRKILAGLHFEVTDSNETQCTVRVPSWRHDATREADLIEEVARLYGFENIPAAIARVRKMEYVLAPEEYAVRGMRQFLAGIGLTEMMSMTFAAADDPVRANVAGEHGGMVLLQNPLSEKQAGMRTSLIPGMLGAISRNIRYGTTTIRAFEIGNVYATAPGEQLPVQTSRVCVALTGRRDETHWSVKATDVDFYDIKGVGEAICESRGIQPRWSAAEFGPIESGHCASLTVGDTVVGWIGRVSAKVLAAFDIEQPVYILDADFSKLIEAKPGERHFQAIPAFPPSLRDLAILLDAAVPAEDVVRVAKESGGKLLRNVDIFDVYTGKQVPAGKKSMALSLVFQSPERTLTDEDTQKQMDRILKGLQKEFQAELR